MKTLTKIEACFNRIENIRYDNPHGGAYAYVQFLAYARELVILLRPLKSTAPQISAIEGISWLFNEYLATRFTHRQRAIFDNKQRELKDIFNTIRLSLAQYRSTAGTMDGQAMTRQAA
jgi:hypothetical protein